MVRFWAAMLLSVAVSLLPDLVLLSLANTSWRSNSTVPIVEPVI